MTIALGLDTKITLLAAGLIFLLALVLGAWKYRQIMVSDGHRAHPYVDIAHRAAAIIGYISHGLRRDTVNQFEKKDRGLEVSMGLLIAGEIGGFAVILTGFVYGQLL
ncbi:MAG TPA: hypothetical protein VGC05_03530 [Mycobacterium sp.]